ncbi:MAG: acyltransferase family protein [Clostridiaceae bacterium]|nr:acyltransferase family protein [Clostridiaceae bacterium]
MSKRTIKEVYLLRSIACLCVVLLHSITRVVEIYDTQLTGYQETSLMTLRLFLTFGTPVFIFLSEFLLSYAYAEEIPKNFMKKRVRLILIPYISMSLIYAVLMTHEANDFAQGMVMRTFGLYAIRNLLFGFYRHGYFIIVIFQFYFLHLFLHKYLSRVSPRKIINLSLVVNLLYLGFFNFVDPTAIPYGEYIWHGLSWGSFPAWIFYFSLGYYSGKNYDYFIKMLEQHKQKLLILPVVTGAIVYRLYTSGVLVINSSKRIDMVLFATSMMLLIYYIAIKLKVMPNIFILINRFSFGIYLLHMLFLYIGVQLIQNTSYLNIHPITMLLILFLGSTVASIVTTFIISKLNIGVYIVGHVKQPKRVEEKSSYKRTATTS